MKKRALRRHHKERMKNRAKFIWHEVWGYLDENREFIRNSDNLKMCSCWMCGNPRRYLKGKDKFTRQELLAPKVSDW